MKNVNKNGGLDENDNYIHRRMQDQAYTNPEKEGLHTVISYTKFAVGAESKEFQHHH